MSKLNSLSSPFAAAAGLLVYASALAATPDPLVLRSDALAVNLATDFPRVLQYTWTGSGATLSGETGAFSKVAITTFKDATDGLRSEPTTANPDFVAVKTADMTREYAPKVTVRLVDPAKALYTLTVPELGVEIGVSVSVVKNTVTLALESVTGEGAAKVRYVDFPGMNLVSVSSAEPGAAVANARVGIGQKSQPEDFLKLVDMPADKKAVECTYAIVNTDRLAATVYNNVQNNKARLLRRTVETGGVKVAGIASNAMTWREVPNEQFEKSFATVIIAPDLNDDKTVDWQDAAIAYRRVATPPMGAELTPDRVVSQISMNMASWAQNPFLRTLDDLKKVYLLTDGLHQDVQFKGYAGEGHDSSHPDYGGNVNRRAGGAEALNFVMKRAKDFNVLSGIHINATEYYPDANNFALDLVNLDKRGWAWMDQSYLVDKRYDITSGKLYARLDEMKKTLPSLDWVYVDVYWGEGWDAYKLASKINALGYPMYTEFEGQVERHITWSHRSQDWAQAVWGDGLYSKIGRFIQNHQKDVWTHSPLLRGSQNDGFLGWHSQRDLRHFTRSVFTTNLPSKYLQHFEILKLSDREALLTGGVRATFDNGVAKIFRNGKLLNSATYAKDKSAPVDNSMLLPWEPKNPSKAYHWNDKGGLSTWELPEEWKGLSSVKLYRLTDIGRTFVADLPVSKDGKVDIDALPATPYVVYKDAAPALPAIEWGEGSLVKEPGFDSHAFNTWRLNDAARAPGAKVEIVNDAKGQTHLTVAGAHDLAPGVSQTLKLTPGKWYSASVWVEIAGERPASLTVSCDGKVLGEASVSKTSFTNFSDNFSKYLTRYQRIVTVFQMPEGKSEATLALAAGRIASKPAATVMESGEALLRDDMRFPVETVNEVRVNFDDVRLVECKPRDFKGHTFFEDFENVDEGWGPFVYGYQGEMRTHLSQTNKPHTDDTLDGEFSLKSFDENDGLNFRTLPGRLPFKPKTKYRVAFDYLSRNDSQYSVTIASDEGGIGATKLFAALPGDSLSRRRASFEFTTGDHPDYYIGFVKNFSLPELSKDELKKLGKTWVDRRALLVLDNLAVDELKDEPAKDSPKP